MWQQSYKNKKAHTNNSSNNDKTEGLEDVKTPLVSKDQGEVVKVSAGECRRKDMMIANAGSQGKQSLQSDHDVWLKG